MTTYLSRDEDQEALEEAWRAIQDDDDEELAPFPAHEVQNTYDLDATCKDALSFFQRIPAESLPVVKDVSLGRHAMYADDSDCMAYAKPLAVFLITKMNLKSITLAMPDDMEAGQQTDREEAYEWFMWTLHIEAVRAFKHGSFTELRFAHPNSYEQSDKGIFQYHNVSTKIGKGVFDERQDILDQVEDCEGVYFNKTQYDAISDPEATKTLNSSVDAIWKSGGYELRMDSPRMNEEGTVLVLRRYPAI